MTKVVIPKARPDVVNLNTVFSHRKHVVRLPSPPVLVPPGFTIVPLPVICLIPNKTKEIGILLLDSYFRYDNYFSREKLFFKEEDMRLATVILKMLFSIIKFRCIPEFERIQNKTKIRKDNKSDLFLLRVNERPSIYNHAPKVSFSSALGFVRH